MLFAEGAGAGEGDLHRDSSQPLPFRGGQGGRGADGSMPRRRFRGESRELALLAPTRT